MGMPQTGLFLSSFIFNEPSPVHWAPQGNSQGYVGGKCNHVIIMAIKYNCCEV